jgi:hypothetical protein
VSELSELPASLRELWKGDDPLVFDALTDQLRRAKIPFQASKETEQRRLLSRTVYGNVAEGLTADFTVLVNSQDLVSARQLVADLLQDQPYLFCPLCKAEIFVAIAECEDCHGPLVPSLDQVANDPPILVWRGFEEDTCEALATELHQAGIPCHAFELAPPVEPLAPPLEFAIGVALRTERRGPETSWQREFILRVLRSSFSRAQQVLAEHEAQEAEEPPEELEPGEPEVGELPGNLLPGAVEIYSGRNHEEDFAALYLTLETAGIGSEVFRDARGQEFCLVTPSDETRAREILREITEGTPPS